MNNSSKLSISIILILFTCSALQLGDLLYARYFPLLICIFLLTYIQLFQGIKLSNSFKKFLVLNLFSLSFFIIISFLGNSTPDEFIFDVVKLGLAFISAIWFYYFVENSRFQSVHRAIVVMTIIVQIIILIRDGL